MSSSSETTGIIGRVFLTEAVFIGMKQLAYLYRSGFSTSSTYGLGRMAVYLRGGTSCSSELYLLNGEEEFSVFFFISSEYRFEFRDIPFTIPLQPYRNFMCFMLVGVFS